eukprot:3938376-Prymnesium_polylepis.1
MLHCASPPSSAGRLDSGACCSTGDARGRAHRFVHAARHARAGSRVCACTRASVRACRSQRRGTSAEQVAWVLAAP